MPCKDTSSKKGLHSLSPISSYHHSPPLLFVFFFSSVVALLCVFP
eukprot:gene2509-1565_t